MIDVRSADRALAVLIKRAKNNYEPCLGPRVPLPLSSLLLACLAVDPTRRPAAAGARVAMASLMTQADAWGRDAADEGGLEGVAEQPPSLADTPAESTAGSSATGGSHHAAGSGGLTPSAVADANT